MKKLLHGRSNMTTMTNFSLTVEVWCNYEVILRSNSNSGNMTDHCKAAWTNTHTYNRNTAGSCPLCARSFLPRSFSLRIKFQCFHSHPTPKISLQQIFSCSQKCKLLMVHFFTLYILSQQDVTSEGYLLEVIQCTVYI